VQRSAAAALCVKRERHVRGQLALAADEAQQRWCGRSWRLLPS